MSIDNKESSNTPNINFAEYEEKINLLKHNAFSLIEEMEKDTKGSNTLSFQCHAELLKDEAAGIIKQLYKAEQTILANKVSNNSVALESESTSTSISSEETKVESRASTVEEQVHQVEDSTSNKANFVDSKAPKINSEEQKVVEQPSAPQQTAPQNANTTPPKNNEKNNYSELLTGKLIMGSIATVLILVSFIVAARGFYADLTPLMKFIGMSVLSLGVLGFGVYKQIKSHSSDNVDKKRNSAILTGLGLSLTYLTLFLGNSYFGIVSNEYWIAAVTLWSFFVLTVSYRFNDALFAIGQLGILLTLFLSFTQKGDISLAFYTMALAESAFILATYNKSVIVFLLNMISLIFIFVRVFNSLPDAEYAKFMVFAQHSEINSPIVFGILIALILLILYKSLQFIKDGVNAEGMSICSSILLCALYGFTLRLTPIHLFGDTQYALPIVYIIGAALFSGVGWLIHLNYKKNSNAKYQLPILTMIVLLVLSMLQLDIILQTAIVLSVGLLAIFKKSATLCYTATGILASVLLSNVWDIGTDYISFSMVAFIVVLLLVVAFIMSLIFNKQAFVFLYGTICFIVISFFTYENYINIPAVMTDVVKVYDINTLTVCIFILLAMTIISFYVLKLISSSQPAKLGLVILTTCSLFPLTNLIDMYSIEYDIPLLMLIILATLFIVYQTVGWILDKANNSNAINSVIVYGTEFILVLTSICYVLFNSEELILVFIFTCLSYCVSLPTMLNKSNIFNKSNTSTKVFMLSMKSILLCLSIIWISGLPSFANIMILVTLALIHLAFGFRNNIRLLRIVGLLITLCCAIKLVVIDMLMNASDSLAIAFAIFIIGMVFLGISLLYGYLYKTFVYKNKNEIAS